MKIWIKQLGWIIGAVLLLSQMALAQDAKVYGAYQITVGIRQTALEKQLFLQLVDTMDGDHNYLLPLQITYHLFSLPADKLLAMDDAMLIAAVERTAAYSGALYDLQSADILWHETVSIEIPLAVMQSTLAMVNFFSQQLDIVADKAVQALKVAYHAETLIGATNPRGDFRPLHYAVAQLAAVKPSRSWRLAQSGFDWLSPLLKKLGTVGKVASKVALPLVVVIEAVNLEKKCSKLGFWKGCHNSVTSLVSLDGLFGYAPWLVAWHYDYEEIVQNEAAQQKLQELDEAMAQAMRGITIAIEEQENAPPPGLSKTQYLDWLYQKLEQEGTLGMLITGGMTLTPDNTVICKPFVEKEVCIANNSLLDATPQKIFNKLQNGAWQETGRAWAKAAETQKALIKLYWSKIHWLIDHQDLIDKRKIHIPRFIDKAELTTLAQQPDNCTNYPVEKSCVEMPTGSGSGGSGGAGGTGGSTGAGSSTTSGSIGGLTPMSPTLPGGGGGPTGPMPGGGAGGGAGGGQPPQPKPKPHEPPGGGAGPTEPGSPAGDEETVPLDPAYYR